MLLIGTQILKSIVWMVENKWKESSLTTSRVLFISSTCLNLPTNQWKSELVIDNMKKWKFLTLNYNIFFKCFIVLPSKFTPKEYKSKCKWKHVNVRTWRNDTSRSKNIICKNEKSITSNFTEIIFEPLHYSILKK